MQAVTGIRFDGFLLDRSAGGLFRLDEHGSPVRLALGSRALDVLCVLVERGGDLVSKQTIMDAVWPDTAVEENNLTVHISVVSEVEAAAIRTDGNQPPGGGTDGQRPAATAR